MRSTVNGNPHTSCVVRITGKYRFMGVQWSANMKTYTKIPTVMEIKAHWGLKIQSFLEVTYLLKLQILRKTPSAVLSYLKVQSVWKSNLYDSPTRYESSNIADSLNLRWARCEGYFATLYQHLGSFGCVSQQLQFTGNKWQGCKSRVVFCAIPLDIWLTTCNFYCCCLNFLDILCLIKKCGTCWLAGPRKD